MSNVPSINVEECAPAHVSETALLAPEEVYGKQKAEVKGKDEMTKQDRNRKRRGKKRKQRLVAKEKEKFQKAIRKDNSGQNDIKFTIFLFQLSPICMYPVQPFWAR